MLMDQRTYFWLIRRKLLLLAQKRDQSIKSVDSANLTNIFIASKWGFRVILLEKDNFLISSADSAARRVGFVPTLEHPL